MQQGPLHDSRSLTPNVKAAIESLLARPLHENESVAVRTYEPHKAPTGPRRKTLVAGLKGYFAEIDEQVRDVPKDHIENAIDEAIRSVRPTCGPVR